MEEYAMRNKRKADSEVPDLFQSDRQSNRPTSAPGFTESPTSGVCQHFTAISSWNDFEDDSNDSDALTTIMNDDSGEAVFVDDSDVSQLACIHGSPTDSVSQHSATTYRLHDSDDDNNDADCSDAGFDDDCHVSQRSGTEVVTDLSEQLVQDILIKVMGDVTTVVAGTHGHIDQKRTIFNQARWEEMSNKHFLLTIYQLQRVYFQLLHENFENQWCSEAAGDVKDLAETLVWKLNMNPNVAIEESPALVINMFEMMQAIFKWEKTLQILEAAVDIAKVEKANAYRRAKTSREKLRQRWP